MLIPQITTIKADAASPSAVSALVDRVIEEEGHLDFFFANAGVGSGKRPDLKEGMSQNEMAKTVAKFASRTISEIDEAEYAETMRINALRWVMD